MPKEPPKVRESSPMWSRTDRTHGRATYPSINKTAKVPKGGRLSRDDDIVVVYNANGKEVERGIYDESAYRGESLKWNERDGNYDLRYGYKMVVKK